MDHHMSNGTLDKTEADFRRDDKGRPIAADGWPISGMACIPEVVAASGLGRSKVYSMLDREIPPRRFGRSLRVEWAVVRRLFLEPADEPP
jgi:hypothetical protein